MSNTTSANGALCYILTDIPGQGEFQGTGVIIGPHTILTAAHLVYDGETGAIADAVSVYPGFSPQGTTYNPPGALGGQQTIHGVRVATEGDYLSAAGSQGDFAVIDTSTDLSAYGKYALDPNFTSGDVVVKGYPASNGGFLFGTGGDVHQDGALSDLVTSAIDLSPGYSGSPIQDFVERGGSLVPGVAGIVSTGDDASKITRSKIALIRRWVASDAALFSGGQVASSSLVPQIAGTVSDTVNAARVAPPSGETLAAPAGFAYTDLAAHPGAASGGRHAAGGTTAEGAAAHHLADLVAALHGTGPAGGDGISAPPDPGLGDWLTRPDHAHRGHGHAASLDA